MNDASGESSAESAVHARASALFLEAARLPELERRAFVSRSCEGEDALAERVFALLDHDAQAGDFLSPLEPGLARDLASQAFESSASEATPRAEEMLAAPGSVRSIPVQFGSFRVLALLAAGSTSTVYRARQDSPQRDVALKVLDADLEPRVIERLSREADTLGRLNHDGIVKVYAWGTESTPRGTLSYTAMELIHGRPVTDHARAEGLGTKARVELLLKICEALQHAHASGVIHRDLKPDNILVSETGQPKLLDFGVARFHKQGGLGGLDPTVLTEPGRVVGTIAFMSPEQLGSDRSLDARTDIYSLGVVAFELLTGQRPHDLNDCGIVDAIRIVTTTPPRRCDPALGRDLEAILARSLEADRRFRYATAAELAEELQRFLDDEPVRARRTSAWARVRRAVLKHRVAAISSLALVLVLVVTQLVQSAASRSRAEDYDVARQADRMLDRFLARRPNVVASERPSLLDRLGAVDEFLLEQGELDPAVSGIFLVQVARLHGSQSSSVRTTTGYYERGLRLLDEAYGARDRRTLSARVDYVRLLMELTEFASAQRVLDAIDKSLVEVFEPDHHARLWAELSRVKMARRLGKVKGAFPQSLSTAQRALARYGPTEEVSLVAQKAALSHAPLAAALKLWRDFHAEHVRSGAPYGEASFELLRGLSRKVILNGYRSGDAGTMQAGLDLVADFALGTAEERGSESMHALMIWNHLALKLGQVDRLEDAEQLLRQTERTATAHHPRDARVGDIRRQLGDVLFQLGRAGEARFAYRSALDAHPSFDHADQLWRANVLLDLSLCLEREGRLFAAAHAACDAHGLLVQTQGWDHPRTRLALARGQSAASSSAHDGGEGARLAGSADASN